MVLTTTMTQGSKTQTLTQTNHTSKGDDAPKYRVEHSVSDKAGCQHAACKPAGVKIAKGELRIGTHQWFEQEEKYIYMWRHWGCATSKQIEGLKTLFARDPESAPGYSTISPESQEQVRLALDEGRVVDTEWKDIRPDLAKFVGDADGEIRNAVGYKVEVTGRGTAGCRNPACKEKGIKIPKGELRLGFAIPFIGEHMSWQYKHWKCISKFDINAVKELCEQGLLDGLENLPEEYKVVVLQSLETGQAIQPPKLAPDSAPKQPRAPRKKKVVAQEDDEEQGSKEAAEPKRKPRKKRTADKLDDANEEQEATSKKKRARPPKKSTIPEAESTAVSEAQAHPALSKPMEEINPKFASIQALTDKLRADASTSPSKPS